MHIARIPSELKTGSQNRLARCADEMDTIIAGDEARPRVVESRGVVSVQDHATRNLSRLGIGLALSTHYTGFSKRARSPRDSRHLDDDLSCPARRAVHEDEAVIDKVGEDLPGAHHRPIVPGLRTGMSCTHRAHGCYGGVTRKTCPYSHRGERAGAVFLELNVLDALTDRVTTGIPGRVASDRDSRRARRGPEISWYRRR